MVANGQAYADMIRQQGGSDAWHQWKQLEPLLLPLQQAAAALPATALRSDVGTLVQTSVASMHDLRLLQRSWVVLHASALLSIASSDCKR